MRTKFSTGLAFIALSASLALSLTLGCSSDDSGDGGKGGSGGKATGGTGGKAAGGSGGGNSSTGGTIGSVTGGSGGRAAEGGAGGGAGVAAAGTFTFSFEGENDDGGWGAASALSDADACGEHRLKVPAPTFSTAEKVKGTKSLAFAIDMPAMIAAFDKLGCAKMGKDANLVLWAGGGDFGNAISQATKGTAKVGTLPIGTKITYNVKATDAILNAHFFAHVNGDWQGNFGPRTTINEWVTFDVVTQKEMVAVIGYQEIGIRFWDVPETYKGTIFLDEITIKTP